MYTPKPVSKRVYLVRHGETTGNINNTVQDLTDPLSDKGKQQAAFLGTRFQSISFDVLYASDAIRAMQTATAIAEKTGHTIQSTPLLRECNYPSSMTGMDILSSEVVKYEEDYKKNWNNYSWKHSDEESFAELMERVDKTLELLENDPNPDIVVVSHGHYLKTLLTRIPFGKAYTPEIWDHSTRFLKAENTGISILERVEDRWRLLTWNDHAHLGE